MEDVQIIFTGSPQLRESIKEIAATLGVPLATYCRDTLAGKVERFRSAQSQTGLETPQERDKEDG